MDIAAIGTRALANAPGATASSAVGTSGGAQGGGFMNQLKDAISQVNDAQVHASHAVEDLMAGRTQNIHQAMVALQQADISFQLMMQVRNKLVGAYEEIQRMQM